MNHPRLRKAALSLSGNDLPAAEALLRAHLGDHPTDVAAMRMLAELEGRLAHTREAEALLRRALARAPGFLMARYNLAIVLNRQHRPAEALIEIDRLLAMYSVARIGQVQIMYRARLISDDIAPGVESEEVALVDWKDIPWDQLAFPTMIWALAHFHESRDKKDFATYSNPTGDLARMWPPRKPEGV